MKEFLKETLLFHNILGCDATFDFITGRDYFRPIQNNYNEDINIQNNDNKNTSMLENKYNNSLKNDEDSNQNKDIKDKEKQTQHQTIDLSSIKSIEEIVNAIKSFDECDLKRHAINDVIYDGNIKADIMLIGEAPGKNEDEEGKPFCGQSGQLLRKALKYINLTPDNLFITNTVYWRPPDNRKPYPEEIEICKPFLKKIIEIISPKIIILCGSTAIETVLNAKTNMSEITGKIHNTKIEIDNKQFLNVKTFPIYHPSYLLRVPNMKKIFWNHLLNLQKEINNYLV